MYKIEIETLKGTITFNLEKLEEIEQHLPKDYTQIKAEQIKENKENTLKKVKNVI